MNIRRTILYAFTLVLAILLVACSTTERGESPGQDTTLQGTEWILVSINGGDLIEGKTITLRFEEPSIKGSGGCNTYGGSYTASTDSVHLTDLYWTEMACMEPAGIMEQEQAYFQALNTVTHYRRDDEQLELYDESESPVLVFVAADGSTDSSIPEPALNEAVASETPLVATIETRASLPTGEIVNVKFTLTNISSEGLYVLKWFTPLEGLSGDMFQVQRDGEDLPYRGKLVKRGAPTSEDYVWIDGGDSVSAEVDLNEGYDFSQAGQYTLQFQSPRLSHTAKRAEEQADSIDELEMIQMPSSPVSVTIGKL